MSTLAGFEVSHLARAFHFGLRRLGQRFTHREVLARLAGHPQSGTLLALVELAPSFGVQATPVRCDLEDLESRAAPLILQIERGEATGFALVTAVDEGSLTLLDAQGRAHRLTHSQLTPFATGIAVLLDADGSAGSSEPFYRLHRLRELPAELGVRLARRFPAFSGPGALMRLGTVGLLLLTLVLALTRLPDLRQPYLAAGLVVLAAFAAALCLVLFAISRQATGGARRRLSERVCGAGGRLDCDSVLHSRWASVGPWTLASLGVAFFLSLLAGFAWGEVLWPGGQAGLHLLAASFLLAAPISLLLVLIQLWPLGKICPLCMALHAAVLVGAWLSWCFLASETADGLEHLAGLWPLGLFELWMLSLAMGLLLPWIRDSEDLRTLKADIGSATATPLGSLALTLSRPPLHIPFELDGLSWGDPEAPLRIDGFLNPLCPTCGPTLAGLLGLAETHRGKVHLLIHWVEKTATPTPGDRALVLALTAIARLAGRDAALAAFRTITGDVVGWQQKAASGPTQVATQLAECRSSEVDEALPEARKVCERACEVLRHAASGVPLVLLAGRKFPGPPAQLGALLSRHQPLLLSSLATGVTEVSLEGSDQGSEG